MVSTVGPQLELAKRNLNECASIVLLATTIPQNPEGK